MCMEDGEEKKAKIRDNGEKETEKKKVCSEGVHRKKKREKNGQK